MKAIIWYIRAYLVAYCTFGTIWSGNSDKPSIIADINRLSASSEINHQALETYNALYRIQKKKVVILDHPDDSLNQKVATVLRYNYTKNQYDIGLQDESGASVVKGFYPGYLQPVVGVKYELRKKFSFENSRSFAITSPKATTEETKPSTVQFDRSCFEQFIAFYDHNVHVQHSNTYDAFLLLTGKTEEYKNECEKDTTAKDDQFEESLKSYDIIDLVNETHSNLEYHHLFTLPLKNNAENLRDAGDGLGLLDRRNSGKITAAAFNESFETKRPVIVDETALQSLYPSQCINDEVINLISRW